MTGHTRNTAACVLCDAPPTIDHDSRCPGADPDATSYLDEQLPDGATRSWTLAGVKYTGAPARRAAITQHIPAMPWRPTAGGPLVPFMVGALINEIVPKLGIGRWLSHFTYHDTATITAPDCGCADSLRCRCDDNPNGEWATYQLIGLRLRTHTGWLELWLLDLGHAAVIIAEDDRGNDPIPVAASRACVMGWCHRCTTTQGNQSTPCRHACHQIGEEGATASR